MSLRQYPHKVIRWYSLLIFFIMLMACGLQDPENYIEFDRIAYRPDSLEVNVSDLFQIEIHWLLDDTIEHDGFAIYRYETDEEDSAAKYSFQDYSQLVEIKLGESDIEDKIFSYTDTTATPGKYIYYYVVSTFEGQESAKSQVSHCQFIVTPPAIESLVQNNNMLLLSINTKEGIFDQIEIRRTGPNDSARNETLFTVAGESSYKTADTVYFGDSVLSDIQGYRLYTYGDLYPNVKYTYQLRGVLSSGDSLRRTDYCTEVTGTVKQGDVNILSTRPKNFTEARIYIDTTDTAIFDSILIYQDDGSWQFNQAQPISKIYDHDDGKSGFQFFDIDVSKLDGDSRNIKIILKGKYSHTACVLGEKEMCLDETQVVSLGIDGFVLVEGGLFKYGCISEETGCTKDSYNDMINSFYMSKYEVTSLTPTGWVPADSGISPVDSVSWAEAIAFCNQLNDLYPDYIFSLPTSAEWEYSAKHDIYNNNVVDYKYPWGDELSVHQANYASDGTVAVGSYPYTSPFGCYDMAGNVAEWTASCLEYPFSSTDTSDNCWRLVRGGGFWQGPAELKTTYEAASPREVKVTGLGFRVKLVLK